jgi:hypothetical protein
MGDKMLFENKAGDWQTLLDLIAGRKCEITIKLVESSYTQSQRNALHVWCTMCARALNDAGIECEVLHPFTKEPYTMPWTKELFKENVYKWVLLAMTGKKSTEEQSTVDPSEVAQVISKRYAENGLECPAWPSYR